MNHSVNPGKMWLAILVLAISLVTQQSLAETAVVCSSQTEKYLKVGIREYLPGTIAPLKVIIEHGLNTRRPDLVSGAYVLYNEINTLTKDYDLSLIDPANAPRCDDIAKRLGNIVDRLLALFKQVWG